MSDKSNPKPPSNAEIVRLLQEIRTELQGLGRRQEALAKRVERLTERK